MSAEIFTKIYKSIIITSLAAMILAGLISCEKDKKDNRNIIWGMLYYCDQGSTGSCAGACLDHYDEIPDGSVEEWNQAEYSACNQNCAKYCDSAILILADMEEFSAN